jgi:hypothetical protein
MSRLFKAACVLFLGYSLAAFAQDPEPSLGDVARSLRKSKAPEVKEEKVIDNDNFGTMMDKAESARLNGQPVFSINQAANTFNMISPDGSCSLSFDAKSSSQTPAAYIASDLPQEELLKLVGPANVLDKTLQVSLYNGTGWNIKEIVVGITIIQSLAGATVKNASLSEPALSQKLPDTTVLYHLKGTADPESTSVFSANLESDFPVSGDWHWAIVSARGLRPPAQTREAQQPASPVETFSPPAQASDRAQASDQK